MAVTRTLWDLIVRNKRKKDSVMDHLQVLEYLDVLTVTEANRNTEQR